MFLCLRGLYLEIQAHKLSIRYFAVPQSYSRASYLREIHGESQSAIEAMKMAADAGEALPLIEKAMRLNTRYAEMYYRAKNNENAEN